MKKQTDKVDDFFRKSLQGHIVIPSEAAKAGFLKEAATLEERGKISRKWYFYLSAVLLLVSASIGLFMSRPVQEMKKTSSGNLNSLVSGFHHDNKAKTGITVRPSEHKITERQNRVSTNLIQKSDNRKHQECDKKNVLLAQTAIVQSKEFVKPETYSNIIITYSSTNPPEEPQAKQQAVELQSTVFTKPERKEMTMMDSLKIQQTKSADANLAEYSPAGNPKHGSGSNPKNWNIAIGVYYAPEWMFNTLEGEKYGNNFGIGGTFHFGRYSIRTGAGLSITKGTNELAINYNKYIGNYNKLDSILFAWNETHTKLMPTFFFSNENVWDSLMKVADAKVVKRYTYLQVPLILGYDFWQNDHFSIGLRGGPILSVLLKTEVLSDNYDPGKNKIILINRIAPERIQINWQILGGINTTFHFSHRLGFELEPEIRYYFNSVYEKSAINKKPWSVGVHAAFIVSL
ncbi:MAG: hypothetical protein ABSE72_03280 [Bacteroidales bacterium]|jgi:hypothetical protein